MKMSRIALAVFAVAVSSLPLFADPQTFYVNNTVGNDDYDGLAAAYDGTHGPKFKIQSAINAASAGDTVIVAPGTYGDEQGSVPASTAGMTVRVYIDKSITLKSSGGREQTVIVGKCSNGDTEQGWGAGAVSGIRIASTVATGADNPVEIEGFTFRDCFTDNTGKVGGVIGWNASDSDSPVLQNGNGPWVVSCTISNCSYQAHGALGRVNAARVCVQNTYGDHAGVNAYQCNLVFCAFTGTKGQVGIGGKNSQYAINCTFANGSHASCSTACKMNFYNSAFVAYANANIYYTDVANCVLSTQIDSLAGADKKNAFNGNSPQIASPLFGDFRPLLPTDSICPNTSMCGRGDVSWLELVPSRYRNLDLYGTAFSVGTDGSIHAGAVQTPMTPVAGFLFGNNDSVKCTNVTINAVRCAAEATGGYYATQTFLDSSQWPRCYEIAAHMPQGKHFLCFQVSDSATGGLRFPTKDGRILYVPEKGKFAKIFGFVGSKVFYVDANNGSDESHDGLSPSVNGSSGPFETIQKAVDQVGANYGVIYVAPGVYKKGEMEYTEGVLPRCRIALRLTNARIRIVSTGSAEDTVIAGEADTVSDSSLVDSFGNGPNAVRCIHSSGSTVGCIQGFTITGGRTDSSMHTNTVSCRGGGALFANGNKNIWLLDCIVTNNCSSASGAAIYGGTAARCVFADNRTGDSSSSVFFSNVRLVGCLLWSKAGQNQLMLGPMDQYKDIQAIHCSSFAEEKNSIYSNGAHSHLFNNLIVNNSNLGGSDSSLYASGNVLDGTSYTDKGVNAEGESYAKGNAYYVDAPDGDLRIASGSGAIGSGTAWTDLASGERMEADASWDNYYSILQHDLNGDGLFFVNGNPTAGAYQKPSKYLVLAPVNRPGDVTVSVSATNMLDFGETVTVTASDGKRKVMGLEVDGVFSDASSFTMCTPDFVSGGMTTVKVVANTNWYVDAVNGSDSNKGWTEDVPVNTLAKAMENAGAGDVVVALPGTYSEGSMIQTVTVIKDSPAPSLRSRVVVPAGVSLVSRDGAESAIIKGEHHSADSAIGDNAMRCVYLHEGARLSGFTVTGGATDTANALNDNNSGAGIFCAEVPMGTIGSALPKTIVSDCIVSNNVAQNGGGGAYRGCKVIRCRFFDNGSEKEGAALADCCVYESVFDRNYGARGMSNPREVRGCTFGAGTMNWAKTSEKYALYSEPGQAVWPIYNCLFLGGARCPVKHVYNCIAPSHSNGDFIYSSKSGFVHDNIIEAKVETDALYAPAYDSAAANAANMDYVKDFELDGDVYGNPRRSNGGMDIGAVETDWRPRYAAMLGGKISVPEVSWDAVETSTPGVMLHDGNSMSVEWPFGASFRRARGVVKFCVAEGAVLKVVRNGSQAESYGSGLGEMRIADVSELERLVFLAEGGNVELLGFNRQTPFAFIVR